MTTYALDVEGRAVLAVWAAGVGHRAVTVCRPGPSVRQPVADELFEGLTLLSQALWNTIRAPGGPRR